MGFGAYLGGIETRMIARCNVRTDRFGAYLGGIETWANAALHVIVSPPFGAYLGGIETRNCVRNIKVNFVVWSLPRRD